MKAVLPQKQNEKGFCNAGQAVKAQSALLERFRGAKGRGAAKYM